MAAIGHDHFAGLLQCGESLLEPVGPLEAEGIDEGDGFRVGTASESAGTQRLQFRLAVAAFVDGRKTDEGGSESRLDHKRRLETVFRYGIVVPTRGLLTIIGLQAGILRGAPRGFGDRLVLPILHADLVVERGESQQRHVILGEIAGSIAQDALALLHPARLQQRRSQVHTDRRRIRRQHHRAAQHLHRFGMVPLLAQRIAEIVQQRPIIRLTRQHMAVESDRPLKFTGVLREMGSNPRQPQTRLGHGRGFVA